MSDVERRSDEEPMPEEPTSDVNDDEPMLSRVPPPVNEELARRVPEEPMPSGVNDNQPMPSRVLPPPPPPTPGRVLLPDSEALALRARTPLFLPDSRGPTPFDISELGFNDSRRPTPMPSRVPPPDSEELARRARDFRGPTPFDLTGLDLAGSRGPTPIPSRVPPDIDASRKRARSNSVKLPPSKRRKPRSVARFFDLAAEEDEDSGDDSEPRRVRRANEDADGGEGEDDDEETPSDREFIDDEPIHQGSHFTIPDETDADALEALAASFKAASASSPSAVSPSSASPFSTSTSSHDLVHNLFAPAPSDERATVQRGEWIRLKKKPYEGKLAWVASSQRFIVANSDRVGDADPCSRVTYNAPLHATAYPRVLPNPDELLPFKQSKELYFKQATFIGTTSALVEGVRVVVVAGEHKGSVGYIVMIREIADERYRVRWAKIQEEYNGTDTVRGDSRGIFVQISHLRRHALDPPTQFRILDRVQVVTGIEHRGAIGRIIQIDDQWLSVQCMEESGQQNIIEVEHRRVARHFMEGDFVCLTGAFKDRRGLVVKVCTGGALELYSGQRDSNGSDIEEDPLWRVPSRDVNFDLHPDSSISSWSALMPQPEIIDIQTFSAQTASTSAHTAQPQFIDLTGVLGSAVREGKHVGFDPTDALRSALGHDLEKRWREGKNIDSDFTNALQSAVEEDLKKQRQLREGRPVGRRYEGMEVLVAWQGPFKGTRGVVTGDFDSPARAARIQKRKCKYQVEDDNGIMVTVQKEGSNMRFSLDIKTLYPDAALENKGSSSVDAYSTAYSARWYTAPAVPLANAATTSFFVVSELDGRWLCLPGLLNKRVDVILKDIVRSENRYFRPGKRILGCEGRSGYLALGQPFPKEDLDKKMIRVWAVGPNGTNHPVRGPCIRPMRHMADGTPINQVVTRVVIIGPDTVGDVSKLGCYGEARPHNAQVSAVKFANSGLGYFHLSSLCRSLNASVPNDGGVLGTTVFT
ncbi:hypothetical protein MVEN_00070900 [Mycena venus]|uniref:Chromatin elongation factor SPT5 n=1 Tax=Mycena venus TaxID=2733690 RepID=A0A8H6Z874_9AGAR|nr:hypothetical protein MVEN_00070900 [Mycena venus]